MKLERKYGHGKEKKRKEKTYPSKTRVRKSSSIIRSWKNLEERSHSLGNTCSLLVSDVSQVLPTQVPPRGVACKNLSPSMVLGCCNDCCTWK
ncbi:hypothetical protein V1477_017603 [Vespula maculifrons]|uniref:Uncharacterized protein n=1 Tax=Vespula maculifrons TaxID=7453 RepID=A0ABD2B6I9_VESMC